MRSRYVSWLRSRPVGRCSSDRRHGGRRTRRAEPAFDVHFDDAPSKQAEGRIAHAQSLFDQAGSPAASS